MKRLLVAALAAAASLAVVHAGLADAARLGGGRSFGMQRSITPPPVKAAPSTGSTFSGPAANPVMPAPSGASAARPAPAPAAGASASATSRWLGPLAGLAAGLGLAALFSHFGLSDGLGSLLLLGLIAFGAIALLRAFATRRAVAMQAYGAAAGAREALEPTLGPGWGASAASADRGRYPPGFDPGPFLGEAKQQFRRLQEAYDRADRQLLDDVTTPQMQAEIARDLATRGAHVPTEVVALDADVVKVVQEGVRYVASVRFRGMLREDGAPAPQPFEELWHLVKPVDGSTGWLLAGIQQYA